MNVTISGITNNVTAEADMLRLLQAVRLLTALAKAS